MDAVVDDGRRWGAVEVRLGSAAADEAAESLRRFARRIDTDHVGGPAFLAVVLPTRYGYTRDDGVQVVPIQALAP